MSKVVTAVRPARARDAEAVAAVHDAAWREAYRGVLPGRELERMIQRRGPEWWLQAMRRGARITVLDAGERIAGYATHGRSRSPQLPAAGEMFELYLDPPFQGLGFGARLFRASRAALTDRGLDGLCVWCLAENTRGVAFYRRQGGRLVARGRERFGEETRERVGFVWA